MRSLKNFCIRQIECVRLLYGGWEWTPSYVIIALGLTLLNVAIIAAMCFAVIAIHSVLRKLWLAVTIVVGSMIVSIILTGPVRKHKRQKEENDTDEPKT